MFDAEKIRRMTDILEKFPSNFDDVYIIPEIFTQEAAALFKRLKIPVRGIIHDFQPDKETWGIPVLRTAQATKNFGERTALINLVNKPAPFIQKTFDFKVDGGTWTLPALVISNDEVLVIYDRLTILRIMQQYREDNMPIPDGAEFLVNRFARGLTTFLDSRFQYFKYQCFERRIYFKPTHTFDDAAIVIQGPIAYDNNYTAETIKLYRSIYPRVPIVVSTWRGEAKDFFRRVCEENSVVLLENEMPEVRGYGNVNLQLESSFQGVKFVRENTSAKFVLKTRTDQRVNYFNFLVYFKNLLKTFPPKGDRLRERIIFLDSSHTKGWPFFFMDFLSFGHVEDIFKLYGISRQSDSAAMIARSNKYERLVRKILLNTSFPLDYNLVTEQSRKLLKFNRMMNQIVIAETYIAKTFYEEFVAPIDTDKLLETSWKFAADYLILINSENILFDWPKYEHARYNLKHFAGQFDFARWLDMYRNFKIDWV